MWVGSCLIIIQSCDNSTWWVVTTQIQSSNGFPPLPPLPSYDCVLNAWQSSHIFDCLQCHMTTFYNSFAKNKKTKTTQAFTLFFGKVAHIEKSFFV